MSKLANAESGTSPCPICRKPVGADPGALRYRPFCSARCADVDLGRWFGETYRVAAEPVEELPSDDDLAG